MKRIILSSLLILAGGIVFAQAPNPVSWTYSTKKLKNGSYEIHMTAKMGDGYRIYSQNPGTDDIKPTQFSFTSNPSFIIEPTIREIGKLIIQNHGIWNVKSRSYENTVDFVAKVKLKGTAKTKLYGKIKYSIGNAQTALTTSEVTFNVLVGG